MNYLPDYALIIPMFLIVYSLLSGLLLAILQVLGEQEGAIDMGKIEPDKRIRHEVCLKFRFVSF